MTIIVPIIPHLSGSQTWNLDAEEIECGTSEKQ